MADIGFEDGSGSIPSSTGGGFDFGAFMQNRLVQQYLSGAGASIAGPDSFAADINKMNQQNIKAQSQAATQKKYMSMVGKFLGKGVDFKSDPKGGITLKAENIDLLQEALGGEDFDPLGRSAEGGGSSGGGGGTGGQAPTPLPQQQSLPNPSSSPLGEITASDLAGLTSEDVSRALTGATNVQALKQQSLNSLRADQIATQRNAIAYWNAMNKDSRTTAQKNYAQALNEGYKGKLIDFINLSGDPNSFEEFTKASESGYTGKYHEWLVEMKRAGAQNINIGQRSEETALGKQKASVKDPGFHLTVESELMKDRLQWLGQTQMVELQKLYPNLEYGDLQRRRRRMLKMEEMDRRIKLKHPTANYVAGKGWYVGEELIQNTPPK